MNKKLLALAVSSALAGIGTAQADTANVNVYGKLYPQLQVSEVTGSTDPADNVQSSTAVNSQNSNIGFRGDVDIGGGMNGWFQVEQAIGIDGDGGTFSSRNSAVGLEGGFGNVFLGTWDTVYKQLGGPVGGLGLGSGNFISSSNILSRIGFGDSRASRFHERPDGYIEYDSPEIGGFQFLIGYAPDENRSDPAVGAGGADVTGPNANIVSAGAKWESGPLYVALGYEVHNDFLALSEALGVAAGTSSEDNATRLSVAYEFGNTAVGFDFSTLEWEETGVGSYEKDTWELAVEHKIGPWGLSASYVDSDEGDSSALSTAGLGANQINLAVLYSFNKRLGVFGLYSKLDNDEAANHNNIDLDVGPGGDTTAYAAGVLLRF